MDYHKNARLTVSLSRRVGQKDVIVQGVTLKLAAA